MSSDVPFGNRYAHWYTCNQTDPDRRLHEEALQQVVGAVEAGEITTLDGVRSPLSRRIAEHHRIDSFEMNSNWTCSPQGWVCPCCRRSKFQISRPGAKRQILAKLVIHHDHMGEALRTAFLKEFRESGTDTAQIDGSRLVDRIGKAFAAYEEVLLCEDCNNADSRAKSMIGTPSYFSFSVNQIREFIQPSDHRPHEIDGAKAGRTWNLAKPAYELRMRLIGEVARAAATDRHWFEIHPGDSCAIPVFGDRKGFPSDFIIAQWVSPEPLAIALGRNTSVTTPNFSRWRTDKPQKAKSLPQNFLAILSSQEHQAKSWSELPSDWHCPICRRSKQETVEVGTGGKLGINHKGGPRKGRWASVNRFCNHCFAVFSALKREIVQTLAVDSHDTHAAVGPDDLAKVIIARPNTPHAIRGDLALQLLERVIEAQKR